MPRTIEVPELGKKFEFPDGTTDQEIDALVNTQIIPYYKSQAAQQATPAQTTPEPQQAPQTAPQEAAGRHFVQAPTSMTGKIGAGVAYGLAELGNGVMQLGAQLTDSLGITRGAEERLKAQAGPTMETAEQLKSASTATAIAAGVASTAPALAIPGAQATLAARLGAAAAVGAGTGAAQYVGEGDSRLENTLEGAAFGLGGGAAIEAVAPVIKATAKAALKAVAPGREAAKAQKAAVYDEFAQIQKETPTFGQQVEMARQAKASAADVGPLPKATQQAYEDVEQQLEFQAQQKLDAVSARVGKHQESGLNPQESLARALREEGLAKADIRRLSDLSYAAAQKVVGKKYVDPQRLTKLYSPRSEKMIEWTRTLSPSKGEGLRGVIKGARDTARFADKAFGRLSTRIQRISAPVMFRIRQMDYQRHIRENNYVSPSAMFVAGYRALPKAARREVDLAAANGQFDRVAGALAKLDGKKLRNQFTGKMEVFSASNALQSVKTILKDVHRDRNAAGIETAWRENYFPRVVRDMEELRATQGVNTRLAVSQALANKARTLDVGVHNLTPEQRADAINKVLRGIPEQVGQEASKARVFEQLSTKDMEAYMPADEALLNYLRHSASGIEQNMALGVSKQRTTLTDSISDLLGREKQEGRITAAELEQLKGMIQARFLADAKGVNKGFGLARNAFYGMLLGTGKGAISNLADIGISAFVHGLGNTVSGVARALAPGVRKVTPEELGITTMMQSLQETRYTARLLEQVLRKSMFHASDRFGKTIQLTSASTKLLKQARSMKGMQEIHAKYVDGLGEQRTRLAIQSLRSGKLNDDAKFMLYNELAGTQPLGLTEMPEFYNRAANGRIFYSLKSYMLTGLDIARREAFNDIQAGNVAKGARKLLKLSTAVAVSGAATGQLWNFMNGKPIDNWDDALAASMLKYYAVSPYAWEKAKEGKLTEALLATGPTALPPVMLPGEDAIKALNEESLWPLLRHIGPGELMYNWFGGGAEKAYEKAAKKADRESRYEERKD